MGIYNKLANIQKELIAPKGQRNDFGKYNYRSCEDILKALKPLCDNYNCACFISNDLECIGNRNYVKATVTLVDLETGETVESTAHAREEEVKKGMDGSQITGASSSYARKYALAGLFCIDNEKDSDATNKGENGEIKDIKYYTELKVNFLKQLNEGNFSTEYKQGICDHYKVKSIEELTPENIEDFMKQLEKKGKK